MNEKNNIFAILLRIARSLVMLILVGTGLLGCVGNETTKSPPLRLPFNLSNPQAKLETQFRVVEFRSYSVGFEFSFDDKVTGQRESVRKLITNADPSGFTGPIGIHLEINEVEPVSGVVRFSNHVTTHRIFAWGRSTFNTEFERIRLKPGVYKLTLNNLIPIGVLQATPTYFILASDPKSTPIAN